MNGKILFIYINRFSEYPILYEYCLGLRKRGLEVFYIGLADEDTDELSPEGIRVIHYNKNSQKSFLRWMRLVTRQAKKISPDLVHVFHFRWCVLLPLTGFFFTKFLLDVRTVHVANASGRHSRLTPLKNFITWFESQFFPYAIALTTDIRQMLKPAYKKIPVMPLGANLTRFKPNDHVLRRVNTRAEMSVNSDQLVFLYSGTLSPVRRIDTLLHAFKKLLTCHDRSLLVIAGHDKDNPDSMDKLQELSRELGISKQVLFTGFLPYDHLVNFYLAADIGICYVPQTKYFDKQPPTKLFEYMAAGLVTASTATFANRGIIHDGVNGFLCDDSANAVFECLGKISALDPSARDYIVAEAAKTVEHYSWDYILEKYLLPYYERILNGKVS